MYPTLHIDLFHISSYWVMRLLVFVVIMYFVVRRATLIKVRVKTLVYITLCVFAFGFIGARLFHVLFNIDWYMRQPAEIIKITKGGAISYGGLIMGSGTALFLSRWYGLSSGKIMDLGGIGGAIYEVLARLGCFLQGCCYGKPTSLPWGVSFPPGSLPNRHFGDLPLHPTQLYLSIGNLFIFLFLIRFKPKFDGQIFLLYLILYSFLRLVMESFRADQPYVVFGLTPTQLIALFIGVGTIIGCVRLRKIAVKTR